MSNMILGVRREIKTSRIKILAGYKILHTAEDSDRLFGTTYATVNGHVM
jgi:hypothetical protein